MSKITGYHKSLYILVTQDDKKLNIPIYQRPYSWKEEQLEDFWNSIEEGFNSDDEIFFGSVITTPFGEEKENILDIVDGQQRVITFTILFLVLYNKDYTFNKEFSTTFAGIEKFLKQEKTGKFRLSTLKADYDMFEVLQNLSVEESLKLEDKNNNFLYAYKFFAGKIKDLIKETDNKEDEIKKLLYFIEYKVHIIHIHVTDNNMAINTFQTINSMGMPLDEENIAKSILLSNENTNLVSKWENIFRGDFDNKDFFKHYLVIKYANDDRLVSGKYNQVKALNYFYKDLRNYTNTEKEKELKTILDYTQIYRDILAEKDNVFKKEDYFYCVKAFSFLGTWVFLPVLMQAIYKKQDVKKVADNLERIIMSYYLKGSRFSGFNKMLPSLLSDPFFIPLSYNIEEIKDYLTSGRLTNNKNPRNILYLLEIRNFDYNKNVVSLNYDLSLEHIYPQTPNDKSEILKNPKLKYSIGNMILLTPPKNKEHSNKPFSEKIELYHKDTVRSLKSAEYLLKQTKWLDEQIIENAEFLIEEIQKAWFS